MQTINKHQSSLTNWTLGSKLQADEKNAPTVCVCLALSWPGWWLCWLQLDTQTNSCKQLIDYSEMCIEMIKKVFRAQTHLNKIIF